MDTLQLQQAPLVWPRKYGVLAVDDERRVRSLLDVGLPTAVAIALFGDSPEGTEGAAMSIPADPKYDAQLAEVASRMAIKTDLVAYLIGGRAELVAVAARFEALDAGQLRSYYAHLPWATSGEQRCRAVLVLVRAALDGDARQRPVLLRLEVELAAFITAGGKLPHIPGSG
jgi:hypothetical protein